jgi:hypothetical protein
MSQQFSATPLPSGDAWHCPQCDAKVSPTDERCWLCGERFAALPAKTAVPAAGSKVATQEAASLALFGGRARLVGGGLALTAPGLLIVLVVALIPAVIRAVVIARRRPDQSTTAVGALGTVFSSLMVVLAVGLASFAAFFATCFAVCLGGLALADMDRGAGHGRNYDWVWIPSIGGGLAVGGVVAFFLLRRVWLPRK